MTKKLKRSLTTNMATYFPQICIAFLSHCYTKAVMTQLYLTFFLQFHLGAYFSERGQFNGYSEILNGSHIGHWGAVILKYYKHNLKKLVSSVMC